MNPSESLELFQQTPKRTVSGQYQVSNIGMQEDKGLEIASYKEISQFKSMQIKSFHLFNIAHSSYIMLIQIDEQFQILFSIYDLDQQIIIQSNIFKLEYKVCVATNKNFLYIIGWQRIIQLCLINQRFNLKKKYIFKKQIDEKKIKFLNDGQNLILEGTNNTIRLRSLNLQKQIFKLKSDYTNVEYNSRNLILIQLEQNGYQQFINIVNIQNRQIVARQHFDPQFKIIQIIQIQDTNDLLISFQYEGLFLKRINYLTKNIESIKRLSYSHLQICIFDDNNMLNLMSLMFYIRYDRQYNIIQRFKISQDFKEGYFQELLMGGFSNVRLKQKLPQILGSKKNEKYSFYQQAINEAQKTQKNGFCFSECNTLYFEYVQYLEQIKYSQSQHIISQDSKYFTYFFRSSLIFHYVQNKCDLQVDFNKQIRFINLSQSSNYLYVVLGDKRGGFLGERFNTYKTKQNLKRCNQRFDNLNRLLTLQAGLTVGINSKGNASAYSKTSGKLIFKQKTNHRYSTFDYQNGIILISNQDEIFLYNLSNRTQHLTLQQLNLQTKLIPNSQRFLILQQSRYLELWCFEHQPPYFVGTIMNDVKTIFQGYQNIIYLRKLDSIVILNQNCQQLKSIKYRVLQHVGEEDVIFQNDQILSEKLILRLDFHELNDGHHHYAKEIILSLESI